MFGLLRTLVKETFKEKFILALAATLGAEVVKASVKGVSKLIEDEYERRKEKKEGEKPPESEVSQGE